VNRKILFIIPIIVVIPLIIYSSNLEIEENQVNISPDIEKSFVLNLEKEKKVILQDYQELFNENYLFRVYVKAEHSVEKDEETQYSEGIIDQKLEFRELYDEVGVKTDYQNTVVIYPLFTASAYKSPGFYDYYDKRCDESCLTTNIEATFDHNASGIGIQVLFLLGYDIINDVNVHNNPEILQDYDKVVVLHNEYVTKTEFDAISNHPKVMYLYPNAMFAEVEYFPDSDSITLVRGHFYPDKEIYNGFDWKFDNSPLELRGDCGKWEFYQIDNGIMLNCYPENLMITDRELLKAIKEF